MIIKPDEKRNDAVLCCRCYYDHNKRERTANTYINNEWLCEEHAKHERAVMLKRVGAFQRFGS
jgi:hypothetical protein